jgi:hypothetical protein
MIGAVVFYTRRSPSPDCADNTGAIDRGPPRPATELTAPDGASRAAVASVGRQGSHTFTDLRSAEVQARESLPDTEIAAVLQVLPGEFRMAVYHADVEGFPYTEFAKIMDTPVTSRLYRGRRQLRGVLAEVATERGVTRGHPITASTALGPTPNTTHPNVRDRSGNACSTGSM